ncbi:alanine--glyoxylate aminotransferase 2, mitochondrial-like isoform X2 [Mytilus californianus]|uniref:alanine--glyoxylate aminotransferase 2, mitochondrial-like isoform X2 n=1 Tax=Mytilus californianus TaxID=6549 RepID=UPI0022453C5A|nr:alanine--glyoxylate aminotransferase 2, mitochondrial-like isoform X2 [Mytilus californianus]
MAYHKIPAQFLCLLRKTFSYGSIRCSSSAPSMPPCDFIPEKYQGISYDDAMKVRSKNLTPALLTFYKKPVMIHQGHMQWLWDVNGNRYLDLFAGIVTVSVGHCHPKVTKAAEKQMRKLWHTTNIYLHPAIHKYAEKLVAKLPGDLKVVYFTNSGSEANDLALLMARMYTGTFEALSLRNAYHGASPYLMGLTALSTWKYNSPTGLGIHQTMNADPYRGPWGGARCRDSPSQVVGRSCDCAEGQCQAGEHYLDQLKDTVAFSMPNKRCGAFFAESIQGVGGTVQFPKNFLKPAFEHVRSHGGVCISDEVQTGFGRLGTHFWGFETHDVVPDIVTMAKGIGNGFPLAAVVTTPEIAKHMGTALHFNTYGGNPMASAVGSAVLDAIEEDGTQQNSLEVGTYFINKLRELQNEFDVIGDVRGKGLMIGLELVSDREKRTPLPADSVGKIWEDMKDMGLLVGKGGLYGTTLRIKPPMCITKEDTDFAIDVMKKAFQNFCQ